MCVQNVVPIHVIAIEIFHWITEKFELLVALYVKVSKVIRIHLTGAMSMANKFHEIHPIVGMIFP